MLVLVLLLTMMVMKSEASSAQIITVFGDSDETVLLPSGLRMGRREHRWDVRWTHLHLVLSLKKNMTMCHHGRCELLSDGSLRFSRVQNEDLGNYSLEVFYENGTRLLRRDFLLRVEAADSSSSSVGVSVSVSCLLLFLLLFFIIIFILWRRRMKTKSASGQMEENVYVRMHSRHDNKGKDDGEKMQEKEEESIYVPCYPAVVMKTPITEQTSVEADDIYV